ncbi:DNA translocase FtsK [Tolumonas osonensis]|uniref:DNA translocase FtsK n=1 Tax=Tolumonas osonensis TaxID=675874 RepID=A0A841GJN3_9GAMM|nr:DNA translocase FtsK 4TM domain-containing protein [Tolumonas osonensis]MBB6055535.1 S-DNA-T family DNA segregation ATPase FtsK/SpoIIIE [Tolumonas osonensis]
MAAGKFTPMSGLRRIFETGLIILTVAALFMVLSLFTYHPSDPGWSQTAWGGKVHNAAGSAGAWLADLMFFVFGVFAYLIPVLLVALGWAVFWKPYRLLEVDYFALGLRIIGFIALFLSMSAMGSMNFTDIHNFSSGGLIGDMLYTAILPIFGQLGTTLVLLCLIAASITLFTGWSWLMLAEKIGEAVTGSLNFIYTLPGRIVGWFAGKAGYQRVHHDSADDVFADDDDDDFIPSPVGVDEDLLPRRSAPRFSFSRKPAVVAETELDDDLDDEVPAPAASAVSERREPEFNLNAARENASARSEPTFTASWSALEDEDDWEPTLPWSEENKENTPAATTPAVTVPVTPAPVVAKPAAPVVPTAPSAPTPLQLAEQALLEKARKKAAIGDLPAFSLLDTPPAKIQTMSKEELDRIARLVESKLADYNVQARVVGVYPGPVITRFELDLAPGMKASKITGLSRDLARSLSAVSVRVVEVIPGKPYVGLELPNRHRQTVHLREVLDSEPFRQASSPLTLVLGQDIAGEPSVVDLAKMPHVLVAGTTGSGKSVGVNAMIISMLYKASPEEVRFIMIDPKMLELSVYEGIPHLLTEVVTDMKDAANALRWCVGEMERRYKLMSVMGVRNLKGYNAKIGGAIDSGNPIKDPFWRPGDSFDEEAPDLERLPHIVVVVDEFADMMMMVGKKVEELIARIAQKARAAGIHLILATQRPSVDVITGLIKANIPTRISFQVSSKIDSRTILDQQGAEALLGMGDMLYMPAGDSTPTRVHGAFVSDNEVHRVVDDWKLRGEPNYIDEILNGEITAENALPGEQTSRDEDLDPLFDEAVEFVVESRRGSTSSVQRRFKIGYNRAARLIEQMEAQGIVSAPGSNGQREVLAPSSMRD